MRLTTNDPQGNVQTAPNLFYVRDGQVWVRGGGPGPEYKDVTLCDYIRQVIKFVATCPPMFDELDDMKLSEVMTDWAMDGNCSLEGLIGTLYTAAWAFAELRERLRNYENTGLDPEEIPGAWGKAFTEQQIGKLQDEAYDLGVESVLHERFGLTWDDAEELRKEIARLKAASTWIPAKERLPAHGEKVIVCRKGGVVEQGYKDVGDWWRVYGTRVKSVTHWMPMPVVPEEARNGK